MQRSGNSYKVRLALARLGIPYRLVEIDILQGQSRTPEFLAKNPSGQVPLLGGRAQSPSRRIERHPLVRRRRHHAGAGGPHRARRGAAMDVLRAAQPGAEYRRGLFLAGPDQRRPRPADPRARGLDGKRLSRARRDGDAPRQSPPIFAANRFTIADIALYAYTHVANQCDFDLARYPAIRAWLARVEAEPGYVAMDWQPQLVAAQ